MRGSDEEGRRAYPSPTVSIIGGPQERTLQAAPFAGHQRHRCLRRNQWGRPPGPHGNVRQEQGGMVKDLPGIAPPHPVPRRPSAGSGQRIPPCWTQSSSRTASPSGLRRWPNCSLGKWRPSMARQCATPTTTPLVSAWTPANAMTLGQVKSNEKSHEITAIPQLPQMLELQGCTAAIDAMGCQKDIDPGDFGRRRRLRASL